MGGGGPDPRETGGAGGPRDFGSKRNTVRYRVKGRREKPERHLYSYSYRRIAGRVADGF
jgi:hypothetical protein